MRWRNTVACAARLVAFLGLTVSFAPGTLLAQTSMGAVAGTVTDGTGAIVPGATVTLVSAATNVQSVRHSDSKGYFTFVNVRPGTYSLTVELPGFSKAQVKDFTVGVNETVARNVALTVGNTEETLEVVAQSELLQMKTAELGNVIEERIIKSVPLQGRN